MQKDLIFFPPTLGDALQCSEFACDFPSLGGMLEVAVFSGSPIFRSIIKLYYSQQLSQNLPSNDTGVSLTLKRGILSNSTVVGREDSCYRRVPPREGPGHPWRDTWPHRQLWVSGALLWALLFHFGTGPCEVTTDSASDLSSDIRCGKGNLQKVNFLILLC